MGTGFGGVPEGGKEEYELDQEELAAVGDPDCGCGCG